MTNYQKIKEKLKQHELPYIVLKIVIAYGMYYLNKLTFYGLERKQFHKVLSYWPDIKNPRSLNEKILWKKIYDRNPLLPITADKYQARSYIKDVLGERTAKEILIPLLYVTDKPNTIPFEKLTAPYIIKPNHSS